MSIYDGRCDFASRTSHGCDGVITHYSARAAYAWCEEHGRGVHSPIAPRSLSDVVIQYEAGRARVERIIAEAAAAGQLIECLDNYEIDYYTPKQARRTLANGWILDRLQLVRPAAVVYQFEQEVEQARAELQEKRSRLKAIKRQVATLEADHA